MTCDGILWGWGFTKAHKNPKSAEIYPCATTFTFLWGFRGGAEEGVYHDQVEKSKSVVSKANFDGVCVKLSFKEFFVKV